MACPPAFVKNEIHKTAKIPAAFCLHSGLISFRKMGGWKAINSPPAGFCFAKSFCFPAADRQEISSPETHLSRRPFVGKLPQNGGAGGSGVGGEPPPREQANRPRPSARPRPPRPPGRGRRPPGPARAWPPLPAAGPSRLLLPQPGGQRTPYFQKGKRLLLLTHPASKKTKKKD